jgi:hypothetical protein
MRRRLEIVTDRWSCDIAHLVEIDTHTLELELRVSNVPIWKRQIDWTVRDTTDVSHTRRHYPDHARLRWSARKQSRFGYPAEVNIRIQSWAMVVRDSHALAGLNMHLETQRIS